MAIFWKKAYAFDDVLLVPNKSNVLPREAVLKTKLTKRISLNIPLLSAGMDTVTEKNMAIAMSLAGGIGIIHKNMSIDQQAQQVVQVKTKNAGMVKFTYFPHANDDITIVRKVSPFNQSVFDQNLDIPVLNQSDEIIGEIPYQEIFNETNNHKKISDLMSTLDVSYIISLEQLNNQHFIKEKLNSNKFSHDITWIIVDEKNYPLGVLSSEAITAKFNFPNMVTDENNNLICGAAVGIGSDLHSRVAALVAANVDVIIVDTAHGHSVHVINALRSIKQTYPQLQVIAGNIATAKAARALIRAGVDALKIGVGPGSICTTRVVAGIGMPQFSAVLDCAKLAKRHKVPVIADGGIRYSGDIVKALAAGASSVMIGSLFAGCDETPGEVKTENGAMYKEYRGMGSMAAMQSGSKDRYFQMGSKKMVPEGVEGRVKYKGPVAEVIFNLIGGLRSGMGYLGAANISALSKKTRFVVQTNAGLKESHPHDIVITKKTPNYEKE